MNDDTPGGAWTGDIGSECGQHWYEQTEMAGYLDKEQKKQYIPRCTWLDQDHTGDTPSAALKFKVTAYGENVTDVVDKGQGCKWTKFGPDNGPIDGKSQCPRRVSKSITNVTMQGSLGEGFLYVQPVLVSHGWRRSSSYRRFRRTRLKICATRRPHGAQTS